MVLLARMTEGGLMSCYERLRVIIRAHHTMRDDVDEAQDAYEHVLLSTQLGDSGATSE